MGAERAEAQSIVEAQAMVDDVTLCGGPLYSGAPRDVRFTHRRCIRDRRHARELAERARTFAIHRRTTVAVVQGYDGSLSFFDDGSGRFRAPSLVLGLHVRKNVVDRFGFFTTLGPTIGSARISGTLEPGSVRVGATFAGLLEAGVVLGPFGRTCLTAGAQLRLVVPTRREAFFTYEGFGAVEEETVRWEPLLVGLGPRFAVSVMLGREHRTYLELGAGGGRVVSPTEQRASYITLGARLGITLERR